MPFFTLTGSTGSTITFSSEQSEDDHFYFLIIEIKGIPASQLKVALIEKTVIVSVRDGRSVRRNALSDAQLIHYSYVFPNTANMKRLIREDKKHKVVISIPKK